MLMNLLTLMKCEVGFFFFFWGGGGGGGGVGHQKFVVILFLIFKVVFSYFQALFCFDVTKTIILYVK